MCWLDYVISDRRAVAAWERAGRKDTRQRAREKLKEKLRAYRPTPLPPSAKKEIDIVIEEARKRSGS
jgi:trimethylamine:corrinoid methyltransferase-like protein